MKRWTLKLAVAAALVAATFLPLRAADAKCASCPDQHQACRNFCTNGFTFNCQNSNACAGTCVCL